MLKPSIIEELIRKRDEELAERKEKRKKLSETDSTKKKEKADGKSDSSAVVRALIIDLHGPS